MRRLATSLVVLGFGCGRSALPADAGAANDRPPADQPPSAERKPDAVPEAARSDAGVDAASSSECSAAPAPPPLTACMPKPVEMMLGFEGALVDVAGVPDGWATLWLTGDYRAWLGVIDTAGELLRSTDISRDTYAAALAVGGDRIGVAAVVARSDAKLVPRFWSLTHDLAKVAEGVALASPPVTVDEERLAIAWNGCRFGVVYQRSPGDLAVVDAAGKVMVHPVKTSGGGELAPGRPFAGVAGGFAWAGLGAGVCPGGRCISVQEWSDEGLLRDGFYEVDGVGVSVALSLYPGDARAGGVASYELASLHAFEPGGKRTEIPGHEGGWLVDTVTFGPTAGAPTRVVAWSGFAGDIGGGYLVQGPSSSFGGELLGFAGRKLLRVAARPDAVGIFHTAVATAGSSPGARYLRLDCY